MKTIPGFNFKYEIMASETMIDYLKSLLNDNIKAVDENLQKLAETIMIKYKPKFMMNFLDCIFEDLPDEYILTWDDLCFDVLFITNEQRQPLIYFVHHEDDD